MSLSAPHLRIRLLGAPEVLAEGAPLVLSHVKARALLFFLAGTGERHERDYLATLLWGEAAAADAHHSLRSTLYRLRQPVEGGGARPILVGEAETLYLDPQAFACDALDFRRLVKEGDEHSLGQAVALYRGPFLQGFSVPDASAFDEWAQAEGSYFSQACVGALDYLAAESERRDDHAAAIGYLRQLLQIEPLDEGAQQRLMALYLRQADIGSALRQYRHFESALRQELELEPASETQAILHDALRKQRLPASSSNRPGLSSRRPQPLPFVGRDDLLGQVMDISRAVQQAAGVTILIEGEGGIGKSRLLEEVSTRLISASVPWMVLQGACTPFDDLRSQGPFLEALDQAMGGDLSQLAARAESGVTDARGQFPWHVLQTIRTLCQTAPLLLIIEDLQWANGSTLNLFGFLAMRLHHLPVLLVGTVQQPEAIPALQRLITLQRHRGELSVLHLEPLNMGDVRDVLQASGIAAGSVDSLAQWLVARSAGNPFLLTEIIAQMRAEGILHSTGDGWQLESTRWLQWRTTFSLPETTHDLVSWRLSNLDANARHLLDILAVAGRPLPEPVLEQFPFDRPADLLASLDDLAARGLILEAPPDLLGLPHHLLRETLLHRLGSIRRRSICRELAEALEKRAGTDSDEGSRLRQVALYAVAGEDVDRARHYGMQALSSLLQDDAGAESIDFVQHLHDLLAPTASPEEMIRLTRTLGSLHQSVGHLDLAAQWHAQDLEWAQKSLDRSARADAYFDMAELALMSNDYHAALETAHKGLVEAEALGGLPELAGRGHRLLGAAFAMEGSDLGAAERHLQDAMRIHRQMGNQGDLCAALFELGNIAAQRGQLQRAVGLYDESAQAAEAGHIHYYLALARNNFAYHSLLLGDVQAAQAAIAQGIKGAEDFGLLAALLHLYSTQGEIDLYLAEWDRAEDSFRRGLAIAEELGSLERQAGYRGGLAVAARGRNNLDAAVGLLQEGLALISDQGYWHLRTRLQLWLAETLRRQKRQAEAGRWVEEAIAVSTAHQRTMLLLQGYCVRASLLAEAGNWPAAEALFSNAVGMASELGIPLEVARVQAAWGRFASECSPDPQQGAALLEAARAAFVEHRALADLAELS